MCPRCGYKHDQLCQFRYHLQRRHPCKPLLSDISIEEVKKKYISETELKFKCEGCQKQFSSRSGYVGHKNKCIHNVNTDDAKHVLAELREPILKCCKLIIETSKDIAEIMKGISELTMITNKFMYQMCDLLHKINENNALSRQQPCTASAPTTFVPLVESLPPSRVPSPPPKNVKIKDFGQEEVFHFFDNQTMMKHVFNGYESGIARFIDLVWFDPQTPQNMNVKILDAENAQVCISEKWVGRKLSVVISTMLDYVGGFFQQALERKQFVSDDYLDDYMEKIGRALEWDLSYNEDVEFGCDNYDMDEEVKEKMEEKIHHYIKTHLAKKITPCK